MATSGTDVYTYTARTIIMEAARKALLIKYETPNPPLPIIAPYLKVLNMLVAQWDTMGLHLWKDALIRVTPVANRAAYKFGSLMDAAQEIKFKSHTIAAQVTSDTTIDVASDAATDMAASDPIDVYMADGTIHSTTISGSPAGITGGYRVTLTDALDGAVADGALVRTWKTCTRIPVAIRDAWAMSTAQDALVPLNVQSYSDFKETVDPRTGGTETLSVALEKTRTGATLHVYPEPRGSSLSYVLLDCSMHMEGFDDLDDDPDMPPSWYMALIYELARIMMDDNPDKPYADAHRLNIIRGADRTLEAAKDSTWEPSRNQLEVDMGEYD